MQGGMVSRAVERKKARREAKRSKVPTRVAYTASDEEPHTFHTQRSFPAHHLTPKLSSPTPNLTRTPMEPMTHIPPAEYTRKRNRETPDENLEALPRRLRRKREAEQRLEAEMARIEEQQKRASALSAGISGEPAAVLRHDPKFINGTFWRDRKEKRARTVFLGGLPATEFSKQQIIDLVSSYLQKDAAAKDYLPADQADLSQVVTDVDFLPIKRGGTVRNLYLTLSSVALAGCLASCIDSVSFRGRKLRCNFAADKSQRAEAIRRRG